MDLSGPARAILLGLLAILSQPASAAHALMRGGDDAGLCEEAARRAARATGVPEEVLQAITLAETGRRSAEGALRPWPWAVNLAGESHWFSTRAEAEGFVKQVLLAGRRNLDVGCFQINHRWHADGFASVHEMFDPQANALYAAHYMLRLRERSADWSMAAGAYHSATPEHADRYRARFDTLLAGVPRGPAVQPAALHVNRYPLLTSGALRGRGSLVPLDAAPLGALFGN
ncbi:transglycosylase SLT domain-containing protein [Cereibacter azotoformans]|uniref:Transglycosylase-like protein with SLT domain n=1 Tax=Cereibacter azotoformans TaxID=43057 RepID=A0A2T5K839_9RHOB|nr:transglycosylase SLT domain-containing protein [Cereibacter azotoformans]AXQ94987.1 lytic transglycosylase domain-containing protein [Cereibacter sphaeroides]MBO4170126.1 transglycosylase SLT domain-containing protein [Cereibacter azotoformans]PTR18583.1 transglycosylase-like protein with SLT domain [Cereibacter azotoformans]UIJ30577.1 transglycosylase SLT domain-containing protein [Cereibacter azotoformans]